MSNSIIKRIHWIDLLKGYMILTVILLHSFNGYQYGNTISIILKYVTSFHMVIFFCISGFLFEYKNRDIKKEIQKKNKSILIPFLIWGIAIGFFIENIRLIVRSNYLNLLNNIINIVTLRESYLSSWFLFVLYIVYIVEIIIGNKINDKKILFFIHLLFLLTGIILNELKIGNYFQISNILISSFFFSYGNNLKRKKDSPFLIFLLLVIGMLFCFINDRVTYSKLIFGNYLLFIISSCFTSAGLIFLFRKKFNTFNSYFNRIIEMLGYNSIIVMLTHSIFLYLIRIFEILLKMKVHSIPGVISFIFVSILEVILIKYMPNFLRKSFNKYEKENER